MKNLKNLKLQELTIEEQVNIDGGFLPVAALVGIWAVQSGICIGLMQMYSERV